MITSPRIRLANLPNTKESAFRFEPDRAASDEVAGALNLLGLSKPRLEGKLKPQGKRDWALHATLGATVKQACVVTLEPVQTRLDVPLERIYLSEMPEFADGSEEEMPEDDRIEEKPEELDLRALFQEALALALPLYPRKDGAEPGDVQVTEPGKTAMTDEDAKPFAGLAALRDKLGSSET